jgi:hypothetical protein
VSARFSFARKQMLGHFCGDDTIGFTDLVEMRAIDELTLGELVDFFDFVGHGDIAYTRLVTRQF